MLGKISDVLYGIVVELHGLTIIDNTQMQPIPAIESVVLNVKHVDVEDIECSPVFHSREAANRSFVLHLWDKMEQFHRRPPLYDIDLLFSCSYVNGFWWIPIDHPMSALLANHFETNDEYAPDELVPHERGNFAIFSDYIVKTCVKSITVMCEENGKPLKVLITDEEISNLEHCSENEEEEECDGYYSSDVEEPLDSIVVQENKNI